MKKLIISQKVKDIIYRVGISLAILVLSGLAIWGYTNTETNYKLTDYLNDDSITKQGYEKMQEEFGGNSYARILVKGINIQSAAELKTKLAAVEGVSYSLWLDDIISMAIQPMVDNIDNYISVVNTAIEKLGIPEDQAVVVLEFLNKVKEGSDMSNILEFLDKNSIVLDVIDLVIYYYFDGAISLTNYYDSENMNALFEIYFIEDDYSSLTDSALDQLMALTKDIDAYYDGTAIVSKAVRETTKNEAFTATLLAVPLVLVVLALSTTAFFEPLLFLIVIGFSVLFNMGSNYLLTALGLLNGISFITSSMAMALQMAISMDYSIFMLHKYKEGLQQDGANVNSAVKYAVKNSFGPILASCLTTVAGFVAISFMNFGIGKDIGFVFAKGIILSFACTMVIMPFLIRVGHKILDKGKHRQLLPKGEKIAKFSIKYAIAIVLVIMLLGAFCYIKQDDINFLYGESAISASEGTDTYEDAQEIKECFGVYNPIAIIVPLTLRDNGNETKLVDELSNIKLYGRKVVKSVMSYSSLAKDGMTEYMPEALLSNFDSDKYTRIIVNVNTEVESEESLAVYNRIVEILRTYSTSEYYIVGSTVAAYDMKDSIEADYQTANILAIIAIGLIIMIMFRSISIPLLLVATIEVGIFINMAIVSLSSIPLSFLGYLIVTLIQLGATIDYAILYTQNYCNMRKQYEKRTATLLAVKKSIGSVLTSALILGVAGLAIGYTSSVSAVSQIGSMIGLGAIISGTLVLLFLPALLYLLDKYVSFLSIGLKFLHNSKSEDDEHNDTDTIEIDNVDHGSHNAPEGNTKTDNQC
ncbi:MAG: MMPL family transporter [Clostridia bacterium]|nr:MMPL family transporter [Clostridia bacterium]